MVDPSGEDIYYHKNGNCGYVGGKLCSNLNGSEFESHSQIWTSWTWLGFTLKPVFTNVPAATKNTTHKIVQK